MKLFVSVATGLCFAEKTVYTQEVLAVVLQQLVEQTPIPILYMRTVRISFYNYYTIVVSLVGTSEFVSLPKTGKFYFNNTNKVNK